MNQRFLASLLTTGAIVWTAALLLTPFALVSTHPRVVSSAVFVYEAAGRICHQRSERSFHLAGVQLPVCARCTGLYVSGAAGALVAWLGWRRRPAFPRHTRAVLIAAALPTALTFGLEWLGLAHPSSTLRAICAVPLGLSAGWVFVRSLRAEAWAESGKMMRYDSL